MVLYLPSFQLTYVTEKDESNVAGIPTTSRWKVLLSVEGARLSGM